MLNFTYTQAQEATKAIQEGEAVSYWLKDTLERALNRDCVKVLKDSEVLTAILKARLNYIQGKD